ncbi:MAG: NifU family protein [Actinomycetota bacterium]|nr:NifU family protein [Actinomycetota bacterium]
MTTERAELPPEVAAALGQLGDLIEMFTEHPDEDVQGAVVEVLRTVDVVHRGALQRLAALLEARSLLDEARADPHVALLFDLYSGQGYDGDDERARAEAAVAGIRPVVEAHGGRLEVVTAEGGVVTIRLLGGRESCAGPTARLRELVEEALRAELPEFVRMDVSPPSRQAAPATNGEPILIPVSSVTRRDRVAPSESGGGTASHGCSGCR